MTHRHKNQTDEYEMITEEQAADHAGEMIAKAFLGRYMRRRSTTPIDSNHGSRTDSNTRGGKA